MISNIAHFSENEIIFIALLSKIRWTIFWSKQFKNFFIRTNMIKINHFIRTLFEKKWKPLEMNGIYYYGICINQSWMNANNYFILINKKNLHINLK